jgi:tRNA G18 (ribose-2'-O)-methylase SpoU
MLIPIDDPADPRIADYRDVRERDLVGRHGRFVAEGEVVLNVLAGSRRARALSLLIAEKRVERLAALLARFDPAVPVYVASQAVIDAIAGFHLHRGILAIGERTAPPSAGDLLAGLPARALVVGLFGIGNHDNVGGVFRNAAAFGADAVLLDAASCDPLYRKAIRVSVGASLVTPWARFDPRDDPVAMLQAAGFDVIALSPSGAVSLSDLGRADRVAALFGAEGPGLPPALMARARTVRIPMARGFDSLNVATTSGVVLHHLSDKP